MICDRIQDSLWNTISVLLDYIELRDQLNQFEMFVSSSINAITFRNCTVIEDNSVKRKPCRYRKVRA